MQRTSLRQLNKNKIAFDAATNSTTTATPSPSIAEQDRHHHYCDQLVDSVAMLAESPYTDASSATVCNSFDLRQHDMMERNQHEDERNAAVMSDSDTSSSTSAELPPGTLAMFEMGASLDDEDYTDESAGEGGLNDDEFARRRQQRSLFAIEKNTTDSNSISNSTISLETRRTDFLPAASPATKAAGPLTDTVAVASSAGTANNSQRKTTDDDFVDCTYDADNDNASQPPAGDGGNPAAALPTRSLRGRRPLSYNCLEGLGRGETRDGFGPTTGICHHRNRSDLGEIHQYHLSRGRTESDPQRISGSYLSDPLAVSGAPSDREQNNFLMRQYNSDPSSPTAQVPRGWMLNYVPLDKRSMLEVHDKHHRYGKNLRLYFKEWERRGKPDGYFFKWLSTPEVQLEGCPRHELESDVVHYCQPEERGNYALRLTVTDEGRAMLHTASGEPVNSGPNAWLFVLRDRTIFATGKKTDPPRFHHSSFFGGSYVEAAGMLVAENGMLVTLYPHSGHYRPTNRHLHRLLLFLLQLGVDLSCIQVDAQRVHKVARHDKTSERRVRKMDSPHMVSGRCLLDFFEAKHEAWASGLFNELRERVSSSYAQQGGGDCCRAVSTAMVDEGSDAAPLDATPSVGGTRARMYSGGGPTVQHAILTAAAQQQHPYDDGAQQQQPQLYQRRGPEVNRAGEWGTAVADEPVPVDDDGCCSSCCCSNSGGSSEMSNGSGGGGVSSGVGGGGAVGGSGGGVLARLPPPPCRAV